MAIPVLKLVNSYMYMYMFAKLFKSYSWAFDSLKDVLGKLYNESWVIEFRCKCRNLQFKQTKQKPQVLAISW